MKKAILFLALLLVTAATFSQKKQAASGFEALKPLGKKPVVGEWYKVPVEGGVNADGSKWVGAFRKGKLNNVLILFYGGGVSVDEFTAAHGLSQCKSPDEMFYFDRLQTNVHAEAVSLLNKSIASTDGINPFKEWTFVVLPYTTGDFHCGAGDFEYKTGDGKVHILHHQGYNNFVKFMKAVTPHLGTPDALMITGFSAGGFGTSILAEDVVRLFPKTKNVTVCVDAGVMRSENWLKYAKEVWHAPEHICRRLEGDFITLDCLRSLHSAYPDVKILFGCSVFDEALASYQTYLDRGERRKPDPEALENWHNYLGKFCNEFRCIIPEGGLFLWNDVVTDPETGATLHTIEYSDELFRNLGGHGSFIDWMYNAYKGEVKSYGFELL